MWRITGLPLQYLLVLCAVLLTNVVKSQDEAVSPSAQADASAPSAAPDAPDSTGADSGQSVAPGDPSAPFTVVSVIAHSAAEAEVAAAEEAPAPVTPEVKCVGKDDITEISAVKASVTTSDCEATKNIIESFTHWCTKEPCQINVFQDDNTVLLDSKDASLGSLASVLQSEDMKSKLGVTDVKYTPPSGSSVFVGILITGLLAAVALTVGYFKCQRRPNQKGERLAEEGTPVDQQNQANTLASDAPLNPPPETPEKPSANGEAPEGEKPQPQATNGHSTPANTADTEL